MAWLLLIAALCCFLLALLLPIGTGVALLLLLAALSLMLGGVLAWLKSRVDSRLRGASQMIDAYELSRLRDEALARRQASEQ